VPVNPTGSLTTLEVKPPSLASTDSEFGSDLSDVEAAQVGTMPTSSRFNTSNTDWGQREIDKLRGKNRELETRLKVLSAADQEVSELHQEIAVLKGQLVNYRINSGIKESTGGHVKNKLRIGGEFGEFHEYIRQLEVENARLGMLLKDFRVDQERRRLQLKQRGKKVFEAPLTGEVVMRGQLRSTTSKTFSDDVDVKQSTAVKKAASELHEAIVKFKARKVAELLTLETESGASTASEGNERLKEFTTIEEYDDGELQRLKSLNSALNSRVINLTKANEDLRKEFDCRSQDLQLVVSEMKRCLSEAYLAGFTSFHSSSSRLDELLDGHLSSTRGANSSPVTSPKRVYRSPRSRPLSARGKSSHEDGMSVSASSSALRGREVGSLSIAEPRSPRKVA
ncbi:hypothetical protein FOL47_010546, partial [Perkinsus chesapeaki]